MRNIICISRRPQEERSRNIRKKNLKTKQIYTDTEGRILIKEIQTEAKIIFLISIYAPNGNQSDFFKKLHNIIKDLEYEHI